MNLFTDATRLFALLILSLSAIAHAQTAADPKSKPPTPAQTAEALKLIADVYKGDIAKANTPDGKLALAIRLQSDAAGERDITARYALLIRARDLAAEAGDLRIALKAIEDLAAYYDIDRLAMSAESATVKTAPGVNPVTSGAHELLALMRAAVLAERFDVANKLAAAGIAVARASGHAGLTTLMTARAQAVRDAELLARDGKKALDTLAAKPADAPANLTAGRYLCFVREDWTAGLPMLALGGDEALKNLATKEMDNPAADAQIALGDGWWALAEKSAGLVRLAAHKRAGQWYAASVAAAPVGIVKSRIEMRLKALADMEPPRPVNLLGYIDTTRDAVRGKWELRDGQLLVAADEQSRIQILYQPPEEYDFIVAFTRTSGNDAVMQFCFAAGKQFDFVLGGYGNTKSGFETIKGALLATNPTANTAAGGWIVNGRRYTSVVKVRKDKVQAYLDNKLVAEWKTNYSDLSLPAYYEMPRKDCLGLGAYSSPTTFHSAEIIEVTGKGKELK